MFRNKAHLFEKFDVPSVTGIKHILYTNPSANRNLAIENIIILDTEFNRIDLDTAVDLCFVTCFSFVVVVVQV